MLLTWLWVGGFCGMELGVNTGELAGLHNSGNGFGMAGNDDVRNWSSFWSLLKIESMKKRFNLWNKNLIDRYVQYFKHFTCNSCIWSTDDNRLKKKKFVLNIRIGNTLNFLIDSVKKKNLNVEKKKAKASAIWQTTETFVKR